MKYSSSCLLVNGTSSLLAKQPLLSNKTHVAHVRNFKSSSEQGTQNSASLDSKEIPSSCPYHQNAATNQIEPIKSWEQVPGPKPWPLIGNLVEMAKNAHNTSGYFLSLCDKYGDLVKLTVLKTNLLIVANPFTLGDILKKEERRKPLNSSRHYKNSRGMKVFAPVEMELEEDWNSIRQLFNIAMKPEFQENVTIPQLTELNGELLRRLVKHLQPVEGSDCYKFTKNLDATSRYAFDAVLKVFLGVKLTDETVQSFPFDLRDFVKYSIAGLDMAILLDNKPPLYKYIKTKEYKEFEHVWDKSLEYGRYCIKRFKTNPTNKPRLLEILEERAKNQEFPEERVENVMITFLQAGTDITVRMVNNSLYRLAQHSEYQQKLFQESVEVFGQPTLNELNSENGLEITMEQYKKLKHTKNFIEEVLRLNSFSYLTMGRQLSKETEIGGFNIPKDTIVVGMQRWATLKDEFVPRGDEFIPERHEKHSDLAPVNNYVSVPFGIGARKCPGSRIAMTEIHFAIINAIRHFRISHNNGNEMPPNSFDQSLLYIDSEKYPLFFTPRDHVKEFVKENSNKL